MNMLMPVVSIALLIPFQEATYKYLYVNKRNYITNGFRVFHKGDALELYFKKRFRSSPTRSSNTGLDRGTH